MTRWTSLMVLLSSLLFIAACSATKSLPNLIYPKTIYPISRYPLSAESKGLVVAAVPFTPGQDIYADPMQHADKQAGPALNVLNAGVLPIRLIIWNQTNSEILIDPEQISGMAGDVSYRTYAPQEATDLVVQSQVFRKAIKGSRVGPVVKSLLGGELILEAAKSGVGSAAKGGMTGGATGAAKGAAGVTLERAQSYEKSLIQLITKEYASQAIKRQTLYPGFVIDGLIFLPSQVGIQELLLQAYDLNNQDVRSLHIRIK